MVKLGPLDQLEYTNEIAAKKYLGKPGIVGTGIGEQGIVVLVEKKLPLAALDSQEIVSKEINHTPISVLEVGHIVAQQSRTDRWRPAPGGVSIGHYQITAGTLGVVVRDKDTGQRLILSNNHVLANCGKAKVGDKVLQPGPIDGGTDADIIGLLYRFAEIDFGEEDPDSCPIAETYLKIGNWLAKLFKSKQVVYTKKINAQAINYIDAALAIPSNDANITDDILDIGQVIDTKEAYLGMPVRKSGRTTGFLASIVKLLHAIVIVDYGEGRKATFEEQIITGNMSAGGDSGSLGVDGQEKKAFGLLFAGSSQATIFNPIDRVLDILNIEI